MRMWQCTCVVRHNSEKVWPCRVRQTTVDIILCIYRSCAIEKDTLITHYPASIVWHMLCEAFTT